MHISNKINITILGAGGWGIALANHCCQMGHDVRLWEFDPIAAENLLKTRKREQVLKGIEILQKVQITNDINKAVVDSQIILLVVPSHVARSVLQKLANVIGFEDAVLVNCAKGIENGSLCRISEIVEQELVDFDTSRYAVLSGPSHAEEVCRNIPTAVVVASKDDVVARFIQQSLTAITFRIYRSQDITGVELGGSLKNVIAIAAGICDGAGFGDNTKAALQPRGLAEITRLGMKLGANPLTFSGLSGMGDLIVTCMSKHSRNRGLGEEIGKGRTLNDVISGMTMVAEGVKTSASAVALAEKYKVEIPICTQVFKVLFEGKDPKQALEDLLSRELKPEIWY